MASVAIPEVSNSKRTVEYARGFGILLVIAAEADSASTTHRGPSVLHGNSPSSWLQTFLAHSAFFHGVTD